MALKLRTPGGDRTWVAGTLILFSLFALGRDIYLGRAISIGSLWITLLLIGGIGLWFKQQWARWGVMIMLLAGAVYFGILPMFTRGISLRHLLSCVAFFYGVWIVWKDFSPARIAEEEGALLMFGHDPQQWAVLKKAPEYYG